MREGDKITISFYVRHFLETVRKFTNPLENFEVAYRML